jgi:AcrR family transcriptional regulator
MFSHKNNLHTQPIQYRSKKTVEDILEATQALSKEGLVELLNVRTISNKSGYSIGAIYRFFKTSDNIFLELLNRRVSKGLSRLSGVLNSHDPNAEAIELAKKVATVGIDEWSNRDSEIIKLVIRYFFKHSKDPELFNQSIDVLVAPFLELHKRDRTGTFRPLTSFEAKLFIRTLQMCIRNPFIEGDPIAGSPEHHQCVVEISMRLFSRPASL